MLWRIILTLAAILLLSISMVVAQDAEKRCYEAQVVATALKERYGEIIVSVRLVQPGFIVIRYENKATGTWTVAISPVDRMDIQCIANTGGNKDGPEKENPT